MRCVLLFIFFYCFIASISAQKQVDALPQAKDSVPVHTDSATLAIRNLEARTLDKYKRDAAFNYQEEIAPANWWQQFKQWFYEWLKKLFANKASATAFKWFFILAGVCALVFLIYKLSGMNLMAIFGKKAGAISKTSIDEAENIHIIHFEKEIKQAVEQGDFRLAVRLLYLQSLKDLTDKRLIDWQPGKTNNSYLQELHTASFRQDFAQLTGQFEYIWYGRFPIAAADFAPLQDQFYAFKQLIR